MKIALLILLLVTGEGTSVIVPSEACHRAVEALKNGSRVTVQRADGSETEVSMATCILDLQQEIQEPTS